MSAGPRPPAAPARGRSLACPSCYADTMDLIAAHALPATPLDALRELARGEVKLERLCRDRIASARATGATWEQIGATLGMTRQAAREFFTRDARTAIADNADTHEPPPGETEAIELAVEEVRAVRRQRVGR